MKRKILTAAALAVICVINSLSALAKSEIYRADIKISDADRSFTITDGTEDGFAVNADKGVITVCGGEKCGVCQNDSRWYITYDELTEKFNVVLDGVSIYSGKSKINTDGIEVINSDEYTVLKQGTLTYDEMSVSSDKFTISDNMIKGLNQNATAEYIIKNLEISENATARVVTKYGITRSGRLRAGDYLECIDMLGNVKKFTFPQIDIGAMSSDFFKLDFETMTVSNLPMGLTDEQLKGAISSDTDFDVSQTANGIKIFVAGNEYEFDNVIIPPQTAEIYYTDCENDEFLNWEGRADKTSSVYTDEKHKNAFEISAELSSSNATLRHPIENNSSVFVVTNDIKYVFENPDSHTRQFNAPIIEAESGDSLYIRERRGDIVYGCTDSSGERDDYLNIKSINNEWHNIAMIINQTEKSYSVYYDGVKKTDAAIKSTFDSAKYLSYKLNRIEKDEGGKLYVDNIAVFKPFVSLGAIEYKNGEESSYSPETLSQITDIGLIFSTADYSKINPAETMKSISVTKDGENVDFNISSEENKLFLSFDTPLADGEYEIGIEKPYTAYGQDMGSYKYSFSVGKRICHLDATLSGNKVKLEAELSDNALLSGKRAIAAVYDEDMIVCAENSAVIENKNGNIYLECDIEDDDRPYIVKLFVWDDLGHINPVCESFVKKL